tara:strand:+ start:711 stop:1688 length:978 start_codon:yes stop_codon:yes gene_type:complete
MRIRESRGKVSRKTRRGPRGQKLWFNQSGVTIKDFPSGHEEHGTGWSVNFEEGTFTGGSDWPDDGSDFPNDDASYLNVPPGYKATLREHSAGDPNYPGEEVTYTGGTEMNLSNFDQKLSELDVENMGTPDADDSGSTQQSDYDQAQELETFLFNANLTDFDWVCYADRYEDLKNAFGYDTVALKNHFINYGYSEGRDPSCEGGYTLPDSDLLSYCKDEWGYSTEQCQELLDYAYDKILNNPTWMAGEQQKSVENERPLAEQVMHAANWQLYGKEGCKYCPDEVVDGGMPEQRAGFFSGTTGMILIGIAFVGIGYAIYRRNRAGQV